MWVTLFLYNLKHFILWPWNLSLLHLHNTYSTGEYKWIVYSVSYQTSILCKFQYLCLYKLFITPCFVLSLTATDSQSGLFRIDSSSGRINTDASLNTFNDTYINLWVEATDNGGKSARTVVRITVLRLEIKMGGFFLPLERLIITTFSKSELMEIFYERQTLQYLNYQFCCSRKDYVND